MKPTDRQLDAWVAKSFPRDTTLRRDALLELFEDEKRWLTDALVKDYRSRELAELRRRVARLEGVLVDRDGGIGEPLAAVLADLVSVERARTSTEIDKAIDAAFSSRCAMSFRGTWDERLSYCRGHVVTHSGSLWVAVVETAGERPGRCPDWRLAVKAGSVAKEPALA